MFYGLFYYGSLKSFTTAVMMVMVLWSFSMVPAVVLYAILPDV